MKLEPRKKKHQTQAEAGGKIALRTHPRFLPLATTPASCSSSSAAWNRAHTSEAGACLRRSLKLTTGCGMLAWNKLRESEVWS